MTDYAVTIVWDVDPEDTECPPALAATAVSYGRLATTVYVSADSAIEAQTTAIDRVSEYMAWAATPIAVTAEPTSATPHFMLAAFGR